MATQTIRIVITESGSKNAAKNIGDIGRTATASEKALGLLKTALAAVGVGLVIKQYVELSNTYATLQNRIRLVTSTQQEQIAVSRELLDLSNSTFTSLKDSAELYARLAFNTRNLGLTQKEVLDVTRSLNQAVILSGAGAREASNAIIQLSQGLASGTLRGDELRSVLEQLPFVADVIAKSLEVDRSALRRLGAEGEITSEKIVRGLQAAAPEIEAEFKKITPTIGQAFTVVQNQILAAVGEFNNATGASNFFAQSILDIADGLTDVADIAISFFFEFSELAATAGDLLYEAFGVQLDDAKFGFRDLLRFIGSFVDTLTGLLLGTGAAVTAFYTTVFGNLRGLGERAINGVAVVIEAIVNTIIKGINVAVQGLATSVNKLLETANAASEFVGGGKLFEPISLNELVELDLGRVEETPLKLVGEQMGTAFKEGFQSVTGGRDFVDDVLRGADARAARRASEGRALGGKVRNPNDGKNFQTANDILILQLAEQLKIEEKLLTVRGQGQALATAQAEGLEKFNKQVLKDKIILNKEQREELESMVKANAERKVRNALDNEVAQFTRDLEDQLTILQFTSDERAVEADLLRVTNSYKEAGLVIDEAQLTKLRELRTEVEQRVNDEEILNSVFGDREATLKRIADLERLRGQETDPNRRRGLERAQAEERINGRQGDPSLIAGYENGLDRLFLKVSDVAGGIEEAMTNAFSGAEDALVQFVQTGEFNFSGLVDSILADITRLLARQAVLAIFNSLSGGTSGAFGGVLSSLIGGGASGARAGGGPVTEGNSYVVGERGPELFTAPANGSIVPNSALQGQPPVQVTIINLQDPAMVSAALSEPGNEQKIVNIVGKNKRVIERRGS